MVCSTRLQFPLMHHVERELESSTTSGGTGPDSPVLQTDCQGIQETGRRRGASRGDLFGGLCLHQFNHSYVPLCRSEQ